ncbi:hypothetical protein BSBH6_00023 [Bacillus subtilis]|nr:hypothetical protein CJ481_16465 [Bacillus subtilis]RPK06400.1 hypothetical protein BSBH6_00023 [Bacillus subtilis]RPK26388.1 hypothetical protein BH5_00023 [Bacillus subtilis]
MIKCKTPLAWQSAAFLKGESHTPVFARLTLEAFSMNSFHQMVKKSSSILRKKEDVKLLEKSVAYVYGF